MFRENLENGTARRLQRCISIEIFPCKILFDEKYSYTVRISSINLPYQPSYIITMILQNGKPRQLQNLILHKDVKHGNFLCTKNEISIR